MKTKINFILVSFLLLFSCDFIFARNTIVLSEQLLEQDDMQVPLSEKLWYLYPSKEITYDEVLQQNSLFVPSRSVSFLGYQDNSIWIRLLVKNESSQKNWILYSKFALLDYIELFDSSQGEAILLGTQVTNNKQNFPVHLPYFSLQIEPNSTRLLYMRIKTKGIFLIDFHLQAAEKFFQAQSKNNFFYGLYFGLLFGLIFFSFFLFILWQRKKFLFFFLFLFSFTLLMFTIEGYAQLYFPFPFIFNTFFLTLLSLTIFFWLLFSSETFLLKKNFPKIHIVFYFLQTIILFLAFLSVFSLYTLTDRVSIGVTLLSFLFLFVVLLRNFFHEKFLTTFFFFSFSLLFLSVALHITWRYRVLPSFSIGEYALEIFSVSGFLLLTVSLILQEKYRLQIQTEQKNIILENSEIERKEQQKKLEEYATKIESTEKISRFLHQEIFNEEPADSSRIKIEPAFISVTKPSGDFYDIHKLSENHYRFFMADTAGMGTQAILISLAVKTEYQAVKDMQEDLSILMNKMNQSFVKKFARLNIFFTGILLDINLETNKLCYVSAGHPDQIVMQKNQTFFLKHSGRIAGFSSHLTYTQHEIAVEKDTRIFLFSKNILQEQNNDKQTYPETRLYNQFDKFSQSTLEQTVRFTLEDIKTFKGHEPFSNDITLIGIEIKATKEDHAENIFTNS